jgi:hypothetical protein
LSSSIREITNYITYPMNLLKPYKYLFVSLENQLSLLLSFEYLRSVEIVYATGGGLAAAAGSR